MIERTISTLKNAMTFQTVMTQVSRFNTLTCAQSYAEREMNRWIVLGDDSEYWVTTYRYAALLVKNGYEMMEA